MKRVSRKVNRLVESRKRALYNSIMKSVAKSVKRTINEGYQTVVRNEDGEPIGYDYERDSYEQELADWEEQEHLAHDSVYALRREYEDWYNKARRAFEKEGVEVPPELEQIMAQKMYKLKLEKDKQDGIKELKQDYKEFFSILDDLDYTYDINYNYPTPEEYGYAELGDIYDQNGKALNMKELEELLKKISQDYPDIDFPNLY